MNSVSVIIPIHNSIQYMDECIESVLSQVDDEDEIILVENGSTDNTPEKAKEYVNKFTNIKYIELGPVGVSVARNEGIKAATKEWITFVDSDDMLQNNALSFLKKERINADIIIADYDNKMTVSSYSKEKEIPVELLLKSLLFFAKYHRRLNKYAKIDSYSNWTCWGKFFRRKALIDNNIEFPQGVALGEDSFFCYQCYLKLENAIYIDQKIYYYRDNNASITRKFYANYYNNIDLLLKNYLLSRGYFIKKDLICAYNNFIVCRLIELYITLKNDSSENSKITKKDRMLEIVKKYSLKEEVLHQFFYPLIVGKKNAIKYALNLFQLKILLIFNGK